VGAHDESVVSGDGEAEETAHGPAVEAQQERHHREDHRVPFPKVVGGCAGEAPPRGLEPLVAEVEADEGRRDELEREKKKK